MKAQMPLCSRKASLSTRPCPSAARPQQQRSVVVRSTGWADNQQNKAEKTLFGEDFGARDPTAAEIESGFGEKVLGNWDTAHLIMIPKKVGLYVGIGSRTTRPEAELELLQGKEFDLVANQVPGWKVVSSTDGKRCLRQEWKGKDAAATAEISKLLREVAESASHAPSVFQVTGDTVTVELSTKSLGGLTENDFIVASRMNDTNVKELTAKKKARYWA